MLLKAFAAVFILCLSLLAMTAIVLLGRRDNHQSSGGNHHA